MTTGLPIGVPIGPPLTGIVANRHTVFGISPSGDVKRYDGEPDQWTSIAAGMAVRQLATTNNDLFALLATGEVLQYLSPSRWITIGTGSGKLASGGDRLLSLDTAGGLSQYLGQPMLWHLVDAGPYSEAVTNGDDLFAMPKDKSAVLQYQNNPPSWTTIGGPAAWLYAAQNALYGVTPDHSSLSRYDAGQGWHSIGGDAAAIAGFGVYLLGITPDRSEVAVFDGYRWHPFAGAANELCTGGKFFYVSTDTNVVQFRPELAPQSKAQASARATIDSLREPPHARGSNKPWQWTFQVSDQMAAGYDGALHVTVYWPENTQQNFALPITSFHRGNTYTFEFTMVFDSASVNPTAIGLSGEDHFFSDHLRLDTVTALDPNHSLQYVFSVNDWIPNDGSKAVPLSSSSHWVPKNNPVAIYVWDYLGTDVAWGHVSCMLDDGTYISWWPSPFDRVSKLAIVPAVYHAPANDPQTYEDDCLLERERGRIDPKPPDQTMLVYGLDHEAIRRWWINFKANHRWESLGQNCAKTVADALWAGGAAQHLDAYHWVQWSKQLIWTPDLLLSLGADINAGQTTTAERVRGMALSGPAAAGPSPARRMTVGTDPAVS